MQFGLLTSNHLRNLISTMEARVGFLGDLERLIFQVQPIQDDTQRKVARLAHCAAFRDRHDCVLYDTDCSTDSMADNLLLRSL